MPSPGESELAAVVIEHLADIAAGRCTITDRQIVEAAETDPLLAEVLTGLLFLHEDLALRVDQRDRAAAAAEAINRELEALYQRTKQLEELKTQFFANVSHELRTPLTLILGPLQEMLERRGDDRPGREDRRRLVLMDRHARLLLKHVNDLLDLSKLDADRMGVAYEGTDLAALLRRTVDAFALLAEGRRIALAVEAPTTLPAEVDTEKIERALANLLANAVKFTPEGGQVRCSLRQQGERAVIAVDDSGPGVPPEMRGAIFERFRQVDRGAAGEVRGTGLGLAIAKDFVDLHRGTIQVGTSSLGGAAFVIELPLRAPPGLPVRRAGGAEQAAEDTLRATVERTVHQLVDHAPERFGDAAAAALATAAVAAERARPLVLVVDDNRDMRAFIASALGSDLRVALAGTGQEALALALSEPPDLIVSDEMMPGMSGEELLREVRRRPELAAVPFVVLTAKADESFLVRMLASGAQDHLVKPFSAAELRPRVANHIAVKRTREILQRALASQRADLQDLAAGLADRRAEAERAVRMRDEFLAVASHELRTPLTALQLQLHGLLAALGRDGGSARVEESAGRALAQARRLDHLIEELLDVSRLEGGHLALELENFELRDAVRAAVDELAEQAERAGCPITVIADDLVGTWDRQRITRVVSNLLSNAIKFGAGSAIEIRVDGVPDGVRLQVRDGGPGIPPEHLPHLFGRFARLSPVRQFGGLGLGLYIARRIVEEHGGTIRAESPPGQGATFIVELPFSAAVRWGTTGGTTATA